MEQIIEEYGIGLLLLFIGGAILSAMDLLLQLL
jgi:hypothetical protein